MPYESLDTSRIYNTVSSKPAEAADFFGRFEKKYHAALYHLKLLSKIVFTQEPYIHCHYKYTTFQAQLIDVDIPVHSLKHLYIRLSYIYHL